MFLDRNTLRDLEVVPTRRQGTTVWSLVDRTRSRAGREALREGLLAPPRAAADILALQQAHQALAADASAHRAALDGADPDRVEDYLCSTWQLPSGMPPLLRLRAWHRQYLQDVERGQKSVMALLAAAADVRRRLAAADAVVLGRLGEEITALLDAPEARALSRLVSGRSLSERRAFDQLARGTTKPVLVRLVNCLGRVEALWSLGVATLEHGWCYPRPSPRLRAVGLVHPFLRAGAVPNDLHLDDRVRVCFVTGPNMAGKSTFLKAVGIAVLLAHAGCGVPAASMEFPTVGTVFSSVDIVDDLGAGESFFLAEVRRIAALAEALAEHASAVAVIDEPFRGTNVHDAAEATLAVVAGLAAHPAALVFVASHVGEVAAAFHDDPRIALFHFAADVSAGQPRFDYRLRDGVSSQRLGMTLLRQERVLELIERSAAACSPGVATCPVAPRDGEPLRTGTPRL